jgi:hypothetical protein
VETAVLVQLQQFLELLIFTLAVGAVVGQQVAEIVEAVLEVVAALAVMVLTQQQIVEAVAVALEILQLSVLKDLAEMVVADK